MSDTPRTDKAFDNAMEVPDWPSGFRIMKDNSRRLERELNTALDALAVIGGKHDRELNEAKAEIAEANAALGDMRSAMAAHMAVCGKEPK